MDSKATIREKNNFDMLRLIMAVAVFLFHMFVLTGEGSFKIFVQIFNSTIAVDSFFIISGFLIFMSYERSSTLKSYFEKRIRRIVPAYVAVVTICALAGILVTKLPIGDYFSFALLKYYIVNVLTLNFLEPTLPGVFDSNPESAVNGALWTIKIEIMFYLSVPIFVYLFNRYNRFFLCVAIYFLSILYYLLLRYMFEKTGINLYNQFSLLLPGSMSFFISGGLLYYYFDNFKKYSHIYFILGVAGFLLYKFTTFYFILPISLALIVIYFATCFIYLGNFARFGDFSYGLYIWHFPVIQTVIVLGIYQNPWIGFAVTVVTVFILSVLSWHLIEKPLLRKSSHYVLAEKVKD